MCFKVIIKSFSNKKDKIVVFRKKKFMKFKTSKKDIHIKDENFSIHIQN